MPAGQGLHRREWGSAAGSLRGVTRTGDPRLRALQINHIRSLWKRSISTDAYISLPGAASRPHRTARPLSPLSLPFSTLPQDTGFSWVLSPSSATRSPKGGVHHSPVPSAHPLSLGGALPCSSESFPPPPPTLLLLSAAFHVLPKEEEVTDQYQRRQWHPTPVLLPGDSQGRGSLVGCRLWGRTESDTTEAT